MRPEYHEKDGCDKGKAMERWNTRAEGSEE